MLVLDDDRHRLGRARLARAVVREDKMIQDVRRDDEVALRVIVGLAPAGHADIDRLG